MGKSLESSIPNAFNRTSMESKRLYGWSKRIGERTFNRSSMESKLLQLHVVFQVWVFTFNRTSMESKRFIGSVAVLLQCLLLIEPVWNRNPRTLAKCLPALLPFNRTSMESKLSPALRLPLLSV